MIGRSTSRVELVALGLAGALLHTFNHGLFKALLFFGAGSIISAAKTRELDQMGGLAKALPFTALAFLVGAAAICGLPPLNGFISELFLYMGMLKGGVLGKSPIGTLLLFGVPILALVGALAVACFVKVYGVVFLGQPRYQTSPDPRESPFSMRLPMAALAVGCILIGTVPLLVIGTLERAIATWQNGANSTLLASLIPFTTLMRVNAALLATAIGVAFILRLVTPRARTVRGPTWDCGYAAPSPRMQYTASSFADGLVSLFSVFLRPHLKTPVLTKPFPSKSHFESHVPEVMLDLAVLPVMLWLAKSATWIRRIQGGRVHLYIIYILIALIVMLIVWH